MIARVSDNNRFIIIESLTEEEHKQLHYSFNKRIDKWRFHPMVKRKAWDGYVPFVNQYNHIIIGLYEELIKMCKDFGFECTIHGLDRIVDLSLDKNEFEAFVHELLEGHEDIKSAYQYQIDAAFRILKYRYCMAELATAAGKSLILYIIFAYLKKKGNFKKFLIVVPTITLISQMESDFEDYSQDRKKLDFTVQRFSSEEKKTIKDVDLMIGTFQTLRGLPPEYFQDVTAVAVDEAHIAKSNSVKTVLSMCLHAPYRFGVSGTIPKKDNADDFNVKAFLGPIVTQVSADFLTKNGYATPVKIEAHCLDWAESDIKKKLYVLRKKYDSNKSKIYALERQLTVENKKRFNYLCKLIKQTNKNTLVLFSNIKDEFGKKIHDWVKENTEKVVYYVDGSTEGDKRMYIKTVMNQGENKILIASYGTFKQGISIKNIHNIIFAEGYKSEILIKQSIGRGMRLFEGKEEITIIDLVDDLEYKPSKDDVLDVKYDKKSAKNFLLRQFLERYKIYKNENFQVRVFRVDV